MRFQKLRGFFVIIGVLFLFNAYSEKETFAAWYEGGALHQATGKEWRTATHANKLGGCQVFS